MSEPTRRLFFAFWPDEGVRTALAHATHKAVRASGGRPVVTPNLHTTLLFLGSVAESRIPDLVALAGHAVSDADVLAAMTTPDRAVLVRPDFTFDRIEFWPKSHLLVAATSASLGPAHALAVELSGALRRRASALGLAPDLKPFRAHVTLARKVVRVSRALEMRPVRWSLDGFALVESRTEPEGAQYCVLERFVFV